MLNAWVASARALVPLALILLMCGGGLQPVWAQSGQTPTPAQMEMFRNLPPDQQQAVLEAMQGKGGGNTLRQDAQLSDPQTQIPSAFPPATMDLGPPKIVAGATIVLDVTVRDDLEDVDDTTRKLISGRRDRIQQGNPYRLDGEGRIALPFTAPINLSGLTDVQAAQRLNADPRFAGLRFGVTLLPVEATGAEGLKPFGYDIFKQAPSTFAPATDIPVPSDYRLGPGDNVNVELFGKKTGRYQLVVDRNGALTVPEFGPIQVAGLSFDELRSEIESRVAEQTIGVRASVTMGQLRSIRIFVVGDVVRPGSYTVSGLSTIVHALFASGGVTDIGSLRNIELKRGGETITRLDLYDLLLRGDTSQDAPLEQGDAIFVPAVGGTAGVTGQVRRPALYEFRSGSTVAELLYLSGGLKPAADPRLVTLERIDANRERTVLNLDLTKPADRSRELRSGDLLIIPKVFEQTRAVTLEGHVQRPGTYAWHQGMRLTDLLGSMQMFKVNADQRYVLIRREESSSRRIEAVSADAAHAFEAKGSTSDPALRSGDRVIVFSRESDRGVALADVMRELRMQARDNKPLPVVTVSGRVRAAGEYPLERDMTVNDLIRAGGGLDDAAYSTQAELTRYEVVNGQSRKTEVIELDLAAADAGATGGKTPLRAYDVLVIKETPNWREKESITLRGEVRFPGTYPIRRDETLSSVIERAGGLTEEAFPRGSVFMRREIKEQERQQIDTLANRLQSDLTLAAVQNAQSAKEGSAEMLAAGQSLLAQLRGAQPTGRLVIDLDQAIAKRGDDDIHVVGGDELIVPRLKPYVTVIGEVQNSTSHVWKRDLDRDEYVKMSGGTTQRADKKRMYVVRANGSVAFNGGSGWFNLGGNVDLEPGDTIVVPLDAERMRPLPLWTAVTTIIYNLSVAVAAISSL